MTDARTQAYLRALKDTQEAAEKARDAAEEICMCASCIESRMKKEVSQCDKNRLMANVYKQVIKPNPDNFYPELSPDYDPRTGMLTRYGRLKR